MASVAAYLESMAHLVSEDDRNFTRKPIGERWPPLGAPSSELAQETSEKTRKGLV